MTAYVDYTYYTGTYLGAAIAQADCNRLAARASVEIDRMTYGRTAAIVTAGTDTDTIDLVKMATCAVADAIKKLEDSGGAVQSERVGNQSVTYLSQASDEARLMNAAKAYLWNTGLMYRGLNEDER